MENCYGKRDRIPRELLHNTDRLTNNHIQTLSFLQEIADENAQLKKRKEELEKEQEKCAEIHALAEDSQRRIQDIEENCLKRADEVNQMLGDQHRMELMQVEDEKTEMERSLKEEILKLRHEVDSLKRTQAVLQKDTEWHKEKDALHSRVTELELLAEGLQIDVDEKKSQRNDLQASLSKSLARNSELHQLQELRTLNQSLNDELKETRQKNQEFALKIKKLKRELRDDHSTAEEQAKLMEALANKMEKLLKEKELAIMKAEDVNSKCKDVAALNGAMQKNLEQLQNDCAKMVQQIEELHQEGGRLNRRLQHGEDSAAFREFWAVKRELHALKEENEVLRQKGKTSSCSLPLLQKDETSTLQRSAGNRAKGKKKVLSASSSCSGDRSPPVVD
ncbi:uncharacterized protein LOC143300666 [Babylonia areolata]|uniref:uncharacterized protein LOC143300666 n=1 Tax=Babylonia areolata TaxID=304850 RepID=UPI003FD388A4